MRRTASWRSALCLGAASLVVQCRAPADVPASQRAEIVTTASADAGAVTDTRRQYVLLTDGGDTIATETLDDGDGWAESALQLARRGERLRLFVTLDADGLPRRWDVHRASAGSGGRSEDRWRVLSGTDSLTTVRGALIGVPVAITAAAAPVQATPWHDASVGLLELLARGAEAERTAVSLPPVDRRRAILVQRVRDDSIRVVHPDGDWYLALDRAGHVQRATSPSRRLQVHRVPTSSAVEPARRASAPGVAAAPVVLRARDGVRLEGEYMRPRDEPVRAVVVFVSGSGPQDRDLAVPGLAPYAPFAELAEALARQGVGSVRLDDRGVGRSGGAAFHAMRRDEVGDVHVVLAWLRTRDELRDAERVLIGHSDGAHVALDVAAADTTVRRVVLLAAPARSGRDLARAQRRAWLERDAATRARADDASLAAALRDAEVATERLASLDPWMRDWLAHDPRVDVRAVTADVLLVHGEQDLQVPVPQADELATLLRARGAGVVQVQRVAGVNHLLLADSLGDPREYRRLATRTLPASVRDPIVRWVVRRGDAR